MNLRRVAGALFAVVACGTAAYAHPHVGAPAEGGLAAGLVHPLSGLDHLLALAAVGLIAGRWGGRAAWLLPAAFLAAMLLGGCLGACGLLVPGVELLVAGSVVALGAAMAAGWSGPLPLATAAAATIGLVHGHVHGGELTALAAGWAFAAGLAATTLLLQLAFVAAGSWLVRAKFGAVAVRWSGAAFVAAGLLFLAAAAGAH
jgi:urease accessory protein